MATKKSEPVEDTTPLKADDGKPAVPAHEHESAPREVKVDHYEERSYADAMTPEQKATLEAEGLL